MAGASEIGLKRSVGWFSAFAMGYGDVGADIFVALGIVTLYAGGAAPLAFFVAAMTYLAVGLAYAELAPTYPYAGGSQVYALRASNSLVSFLAGWALILDYTICISLFAVAAAGYLGYIVPLIQGLSLSLPAMGVVVPWIGLVGGILVALLIVINYIGIKYSAGFIAVLVLIGIAIQAVILGLGYLLAFDPRLFLSQLQVLGNSGRLPEVGYLPGLSLEANNFLYGLTLAMASFIGIESIAQASEETKRPHRWLPRAAKLSVASVFLSVMLFSVLSTGVLEWEEIGEAFKNPVATLVAAFPNVGAYLAPFVALTAFVLCYASSNTGVIGSSRLVASMGRFELLPKWFCYIHPLFRTPSRTVVIFGAVGLMIALIGDIPLIASLYNFGALLSYMLLMLSLLLLRVRDMNVYRPWKIPLSVRLRLGGREVEMPLLGFMGLAATTALWVLVVLLHPLGRTFGFVWMGIGMAIYLTSRVISKKSILGRAEAELVAPAAYMMEVGVLVRPYENPETVKRVIRHSLDKRFKIRLISILESSLIGEAGRIKQEVEQDLAEICRWLRSQGYEATYAVRVGDFTEEVERELEAGGLDMLAYIKRGVEKAALEKGHEPSIRKIMQRRDIIILALKRAPI